MNKIRRLFRFMVLFQLLLIIILCIYEYKIIHTQSKESQIIKDYRSIYDTSIERNDIKGSFDLLRKQILLPLSKNTIDDALSKSNKNNSNISNKSSKISYDSAQSNPKSNYSIPSSSTTKATSNTSSDSDSYCERKAKIDCILSIPIIQLEKPIYTGERRMDYLEQYGLITSSPDMNYTNGGNYIICGHASRIYGHSLNRLKELSKGDLIQIEKEGERYNYTITEITYEDKNKCSKHFSQSQIDMLTIVSCAKYVSEDSYIIIHASKKIALR